MKKRRHPSAERSKRSRRGFYIALTACLAVLVLLNMLLIFFFSSESMEESGNLSAGVTRRVMELVYPDFEELPAAEQEAVIQQAHKFVRKAAHFSEFGLLGLLTASLLLFVSGRLKKFRPWLTWLGSIGFTLLYAISDEVHQIFSDRGACVTDVLIDFSGALCGILLMHGLVWLISRPKKGKHRSGSAERRRKRCKTPATD